MFNWFFLYSYLDWFCIRREMEKHLFNAVEQILFRLEWNTNCWMFTTDIILGWKEGNSSMIQVQTEWIDIEWRFSIRFFGINIIFKNDYSMKINWNESSIFFCQKYSPNVFFLLLLNMEFLFSFQAYYLIWNYSFISFPILAFDVSFLLNDLWNKARLLIVCRSIIWEQSSSIFFLLKC